MVNYACAFSQSELGKYLEWIIITINECGWLMKNYGDQGGCYTLRGRRLRQITPPEISIILHMKRKPNSIIVLLFIQNNSWFKNIAKTCLPPSMLCSSSIVHLRGFHLRKYSLNIRYRPSRCHLAVLFMFLAFISHSSYSWNEWNVRQFCFYNQNNSTSSPGPIG